jgi:hypothetical protein
MRRFALVGFAVLVVVVVGAVAALSLVTSGGESPDATITTFEPRVAVGNESAGAMSGSGEVVTCNEQGPMPGNAGLSGRLLVERPVGDDGPREGSFRLVVTVGDDSFTDSLNATLTPGGSTRFLLFAVVDQPDSLSGGDEVSVRARIELGNGTAVTSTDRTVTVTERDIPCADEREG